MAGWIYVNGTYHAEDAAAVSVLDHGLLYGDGVFEGIRAYNGRVFKLERHVERLIDSARALRIELPLSAPALAGVVVDVCRRNAIVDGYVRLLVTRGRGDLGIDPRSCSGPQVIAIARPQISLYRDRGQGIAMVTSSFRRPTPDSLSPSVKSLNYVNNVLARMEANDRGADEALLLDASGYVAEASADNVFIVTARGLVTPPTATNLAGITRETVMEIAADTGLPCHEGFFNLFEVWSAREVFVCGTGAEIVPVTSVDRRVIGDGNVGPVTTGIMKAYRQVVSTTGTPIDEATTARR
jgi:branched-chain amino acid aminotransferase